MMIRNIEPHCLSTVGTAACKSPSRSVRPTSIREYALLSGCMKNSIFIILLLLVLPTVGQASVTLVQHASKDVGATTSSSLAFNSNNTAGNWIAVCVRAGLSGETITVSDSNSNTYHMAKQLNETGNGNTLAIFYAENIIGGANIVTVSITTSATIRFAVLEYSGVATSSSLDVTAGATGSSASPSSGPPPTTSATLSFASNNTAGNWIAVCVRAGVPGETISVSDSRGNTYQKVDQFNEIIDGDTLAIFYAENIAGGANTITVTDTTPATLRIAILEYSGVATSNSLDVTATATGTSVSPNSGSATTTANGELLVGMIMAGSAATFTAGSGYTTEEAVPAEPNTKLMVEDQIQAAAGTASANASLATSDDWAAALATFKAASGTSIRLVQHTSKDASGSTSASGDLLLGAILTGNAATFTAGSSYTTEETVPAEPNTRLLVEDQIQAAAGTASANASLAAADNWAAALAGFKAGAGGGGGGTPSITSLNPTSGAVGTSVTITGTNFGSSQGTSTVTFNGTSATPCPTCWSATSITSAVPSGATTGNVVVTVGGVASNGVAFTVASSPTITSFSPASASIGTLISVTGTNFNANNATPVITLNQQGGGTIPASISSFTATNVSFVIPTGATTGPITVTVNGLNAVSSTSLTVTAASSFTLNAAPGTATLLPGQTTTVNVTLTSTNGFTQLAALGVSGLPSGVTAAFQPPQITAGQFSILTLTASSGQAPGANGLTITGSATVQGIAQSSSASVTLQVQGTSGVAFAGQVAVTDAYNTPLVGVTVRMMGVNQTGVSTGCTGSASTDGSGNFVLNGLSASCAGGQLIQYDPSTVTSPSPGTYSGVTLSYQLTSGQVTTPGIIVHLPRVDNAETFSVQQNASVDQTFISRSIPGVTITVYAGTTLTKADGTHPSPFPLAVVEIPYDRLPELMPPNPTQDPVFAMSIEPFNSSSSQPVAVSFPNRHESPPGTDMPLTSLNPTMGIMQNYGTGAVSSDGTQVVPDLDSAHPGHRYGISHFDWHFPTPGPTPQNLCPDATSHVGGGCPKSGDPIDLASGLPVVTKTDIGFGGARGQVGITRVFRGATTSPGPFGIGTGHNYNYILDVTHVSGGLINLIMPDGNQFPFVQTGAIFVNTPIPSLQGAVISNLSCASANVCSAILRWKNGSSFNFQALNTQGDSFLMSMTDSNGNKTTLVRNALAEITQIIDPVGRSLNLTYDGSQRITSISDPIGRTVQYAYNPQGYLATVTDANSPAGVTTYGYDANNNLQTIEDARGITYLTNTYDPNGRVIQQQTVDGAITKFVYALANPSIPTSPVLLTSVTDPLGNQTTYHFNASGFLLDVTDALGRKTVYTRDPGTNLLLSVTDPLGRQTVVTYDAAGNMTSVTVVGTSQNLTSASFTYEPIFNNLSTITDALGHTTSLAYDKAGNLTSVTDPVDPPASLAYDGSGELVAATDPLGNTGNITYDSFGNLAQFKDPLARILSRVVDAVGRTQSVTNPLGQKIQYQYSPLNLVTQITDPLNGQTSLSYDPNGNVLSLVDSLGSTHTTIYTYDSMDRVQTRKDPLGNSESYQYDLDGNLTQFTDRRGKVTTFKYDAVNRLTFAGFGTTGGSNYESTINYSYDVGDRLVQVVDSISGTISRSYDGLDRLISEVTPQGSVSYSYDAASRRTSMSVSGQSATSYSYDNADRLTQIAQGSANVTIVPDSDNRRQSLTLPNGVKMAYGYDAASQLTGVTYMQGSNTLGSLSYSYDLAGRRTNVGGSFARTGVPQAVSSASYNVNNQLTNWKGANLTYDLNGNLTNDGTNTYTWNARNQLVSVSGAVNTTFQYDAFGRRVSKTIGGTTQYLYDGVNPVQELSGTAASANLLTGGVDEYFQRTDSAGGRSFLTDALGSTLALADSTGTVQTSYTFEPFGNTTATGAATTNSFAYTGRELDPTGLYFYRARYYSPTLQRFISEDPLGLKAGPHAYAYAWNNPINLVDPLGLESGATYKLMFDVDKNGPFPPMFPLAGRKPGPDRVNTVNKCAGELSQAGSVSNVLMGGHFQLIGSNTFGDVANFGASHEGDSGAALAADAAGHTLLEGGTQVAVGTVASIGKAVSNNPGVYNPITVGTTTRTAGMTSAGKIGFGVLEDFFTGKVFLDGGVYIGALVVCSEE
jgi:RHS repeat-associated protein